MNLIRDGNLTFQQQLQEQYSYMDQETYYFIITFAFNLVCFSFTLLTFGWLRKQRDDKVVGKPATTKKTPKHQKEQVIQEGLFKRLNLKNINYYESFLSHQSKSKLEDQSEYADENNPLYSMSQSQSYMESQVQMQRQALMMQMEQQLTPRKNTIINFLGKLRPQGFTMTQGGTFQFPMKISDKYQPILVQELEEPSFQQNPSPTGLHSFTTPVYFDQSAPGGMTQFNKLPFILEEDIEMRKNCSFEPLNTERQPQTMNIQEPQPIQEQKLLKQKSFKKNAEKFRRSKSKIEPPLNIDQIYNTPRDNHKTFFPKPEHKKKMFSWLIKLYKHTDDFILEKCGEEILFYLKYEKYCAILFLVMWIANIPVTYIYLMSSFDNSQINFTSFLQRFTVRSLIDIEKGGEVVQNEQIKLWATLTVFIFHIMFQHLQIYMYQQECDAWRQQDIKVSLNKNLDNYEKHIRDNCLVISGFNQNDDPKTIEKFLKENILKLLNDEKLAMATGSKKNLEQLQKAHSLFKENCAKLYEMDDCKEYYQNPMFSIHVPGDYNSMSDLIDQYQDQKKISQFCLKRLKQNQIDDEQDNIYYKQDPDKADIPFSNVLKDKQNQRRMIQSSAYLGESKWKKWVPIQYCEMNYCTNMSRQILKVIKEKDQVAKVRNIGFGFIYFNDAGDKLLKRMFKYNFRSIIKAGEPLEITYDSDEDNLLGKKPDQMKYWNIKEAPCHTDIIWPLFCTKFSFMNLIFSILLNLMLFLITILCISPVTFLGNFRFIKNELIHYVSEDSEFFNLAVEQFAPLVLMLFNYQFIPIMVSKTGEFSDYELKSDKHISNMRRYYFFLMLNTIILPISGLTSMESFKDLMFSKGLPKGLVETHTIITQNLVKSSSFFIRYLMSCTFLSSCFLIVDMGHQLYKLFFLGQMCRKRGTWEEIQESEMRRKLSPYKDRWYFDMGYNIAFTQIIYCVVLVFASVAPLITLFGSLYFTIKYFIDKYNVLYVYPTEYDGQGRLYKKIIGMQYFGMAFSQVIMFGIFVLIFGSRYQIQCIVIVALQIICWFVYKISKFLPFDRFKQWLAQGFYTEEQEKEILEKINQEIIKSQRKKADIDQNFNKMVQDIKRHKMEEQNANDFEFEKEKKEETPNKLEEEGQVQESTPDKEAFIQKQISNNEFLKIAYSHPVEEFMFHKQQYFRAFDAQERLKTYLKQVGLKD